MIYTIKFSCNFIKKSLFVKLKFFIIENKKTVFPNRKTLPEPETHFKVYFLLISKVTLRRQSSHYFIKLLFQKFWISAKTNLIYFLSIPLIIYLFLRESILSQFLITNFKIMLLKLIF